MGNQQNALGTIITGAVAGGLCWWILDGIGEALGIGIGLLIIAVGVYSLYND